MKSTPWKIASMLSPLMALLLPSCSSIASPSATSASANSSALYDPPTVTLSPRVPYRFQEGTLMGTGQKFHNDYSYRRAVIIGGGK